jgi:hypothetical protein
VFDWLLSVTAHTDSFDQSGKSANFMEILDKVIELAKLDIADLNATFSLVNVIIVWIHS